MSKGKAIVPLVTLTEGMDESNPKRHRTLHPIHLAAFGMTAEAFRENAIAVLTERYDLDKVKRINIHEDGAPWILALQQLIPDSRLVLDGYHLEKELRSFLRLDGAKQYAVAIRQAMKKDDYEAFERYCESVYTKQATQNSHEKVKNFVEYCANHWSATVVQMSKETYGSCTEPQVSHVLSARLSRNPIAWGKDGLNRMTMLVVYGKNGGKVRGEDVRIRINRESKTGFREDGYTIYRDYANKQADEVMKAKYDWSIFEHERADLGMIDWIYMLRKSLGSLQSLQKLIS